MDQMSYPMRVNGARIVTDRIPRPYPEETPHEPRRAREDEEEGEEEERDPQREHETEEEPVEIA